MLTLVRLVLGSIQSGLLKVKKEGVVPTDHRKELNWGPYTKATWDGW